MQRRGWELWIGVLLIPFLLRLARDSPKIRFCCASFLQRSPLSFKFGGMLPPKKGRAKHIPLGSRFFGKVNLEDTG